MDISSRVPMGSDYTAMLTIREESARVDRVDPKSTCEDGVLTLNNLQKNAANATSDQFLFMTINDKVVGYAHMNWWVEADGTWVYLHNEWVQPSYRTLENLHQFLDRIQAHLKDHADRHGRTSTAVFATNASETEVYRSELLLARDYQCVWTMVEMEFNKFASLQTPDEPTGIVIRSPRQEEYRRIWEANNAIYKDTWGSVSINEADFGNFVARSLRCPELCAVAMDSNQLAGFVLSFIQNGIGVIDEVTTVREYQKRGIGRALLVQVLVWLYERGVTTVRLHTDAANGAGGRALYEKIGFWPVKLYGRYRKPMAA